MLTASLLSTMIGMHLPGPGCVYLGQTLRFTSPVRIGDTVSVHAEVVELFPEKLRARLKTVCRNQRGETVLEGEAMAMMLES
jgi:3-hydroxybutyryl-CoA dehydratase